MFNISKYRIFGEIDKKIRYLLFNSILRLETCCVLFAVPSNWGDLKIKKPEPVVANSGGSIT
jgi:hypothetical protein